MRGLSITLHLRFVQVLDDFLVLVVVTYMWGLFLQLLSFLDSVAILPVVVIFSV